MYYSLIFGSIITVLCWINMGFTLWNLLFGLKVSLVYYMLLFTDAATFCLTYYILNRITKTRMPSICMCMFTIGMCQILKTIKILSYWMTAFFNLSELMMSITISGFLIYYLMTAMSYFYRGSNKHPLGSIPSQLRPEKLALVSKSQAF